MTVVDVTIIVSILFQLLCQSTDAREVKFEVVSNDSDVSRNLYNNEV